MNPESFNGTIQRKLRADSRNEGCAESKLAEGERKLCSAVIQRAIADMLGNDRNQQRTAMRWLFSDDRTLLSAHWICEVLEIGLVEIRRRLQSPEGREGLRARIVTARERQHVRKERVA